MSLVNDKLAPHERAKVLRDAGFKIRKDSGQINNIKNIAYEDTNGDLCINLDTGMVNDMGDPSYSGDIFTLLSKTLNKDFQGVVKYIESIIRRSLSDDFDGRNQAGSLYGGNRSGSGSNKKTNDKKEKRTKEPSKPKRFWDAEKWKRMQKCQAVLEERGITDEMSYIEEYDGIGIEELKKCNCGIYGYGDFELGLSGKTYNKKLYYIFPYASGAMLYRRNDDGKEVKHVKGSQVKDSFYNIGKNEDEHNVIFVMKSPRECMNFMKYTTDWKVIGLVSGENVREITTRQKEQLDKIVKKGECVVNVILDCDNPDAYENSLIFSQLLNEYLDSKATIHLVNIYRYSEGKFKDFTDIVQYSMKKKSWNPKDNLFTKIEEKSSTMLTKAIIESEVIR